MRYTHHPVPSDVKVSREIRKVITILHVPRRLWTRIMTVLLMMQRRENQKHILRNQARFVLKVLHRRDSISTPQNDSVLELTERANFLARSLSIK